MAQEAQQINYSEWQLDRLVSIRNSTEKRCNFENKVKKINDIEAISTRSNRNKPILSITINQTTYDNLDKYCKKYHINKSSLMDKIINDFLDLNL